ncbi:MAG: DUF2162 domain-containing protein [Deltaproteobacteria bacterium]|nr:DUF2162 domain-containing protein [Deltaproteobacteria bacterium]
MITDFWAAGILFSIIVFAGKAGLVAGSANMKTRWIIGLALLYGVLSLLMGIILKILNPLDYFDFFQKFMSQGVIVHFLFSIGLMAWGLYIMQRSFRDHAKSYSRAGYILIFPCPICLSAMLLSCSVFSALTGVDPVKTGVMMAAVFFVIILLTAISSRFFVRQRNKSKNGELLLGFIMTMAGLYFIISIIVIPVYSKAKALLSAGGMMMRDEDIHPAKMALLAAVVLFILLLGFVVNRRKNNEIN